MKTFKSLTVVLGLVFAVSLTSCQKDQDPMGVYSPKKKIQRIFISAPYMDKTPYQNWEWNENQLKSITHYYYFKKGIWMEQFTYDQNNRITRVDDFTHSSYISYDYDGDNLKSATVFYNNAIVSTWAIEYEDNKISKLTGTIYENYYKASGEALHLDPLSHLFPTCLYEKVAQCEQKLAEQRQTNKTYSLVLLVTWTGQNITKLIMTGDGDYTSFDMQYDDKINPQNGLMGTTENYYMNFGSGHLSFCQNNITMIVTTDFFYPDTTRYAYQYDSDNYPICQTIYKPIEEDEKTVLYYEY